MLLTRIDFRTFPDFFGVKLLFGKPARLTFEVAVADVGHVVAAANFGHHSGAFVDGADKSRNCGTTKKLKVE